MSGFFGVLASVTPASDLDLSGFGIFFNIRGVKYSVFPSHWNIFPFEFLLGSVNDSISKSVLLKILVCDILESHFLIQK